MNIVYSQDLAWAVVFRLAKVLVILIGTWILARVGLVFIDRLLAARPPGKLHLNEKRVKTLSALLKSILRYSLYFIAAMIILREFSIDTTSLIAGAGIIGLAIGIGAQSLVKDLITGFFIIFEDQYAVGDIIKIDNIVGTVEDLGFRVTQLREHTGVLHIIPNSSITRVTNYSRGNMVAIVDVPLTNEVPFDRALVLMEQACRDVYAEKKAWIIEGPEILGITELGSTELTVRITAKTVALEHWEVERALRKRIKELFTAAGIPFPAYAVLIHLKQPFGGDAAAQG